MPTLHGHSLVAGSRSAGTGTLFHAVSPIDGATLTGNFHVAALADIDAALKAAAQAAAAFRTASGETRAELLEALGAGILALGDELIDRARLETGLLEPRLKNERARTVAQLRMFAAIARDNSWVDARIETGNPDLRRMMLPLGPVVVFGASNFPFAYSVAGGDTASALATGNPVIVKAHEAHPGTSELVGEVIAAALRKTGLPAGIFSLLQGSGRILGAPLARHPHTKAIGFTGSLTAGRALFDAAASRPDPIPVFAEMGSLNPIVILPGGLTNSSAAPAIARSILDGAGQFCTKPGIILLPKGPGADAFRQTLAASVSAAAPTAMLHAGIASSFANSCAALDSHPALEVLARATAAATGAQGAALVVATDAAAFLADEALRHEVFGPFAVVVTYQSVAEATAVLGSLGGQLTASVFGEADEIAASGLLDLFQQIAGRVIVNGVPTGVAVGSAMQHGGPWPASSDSRFTAVGTAALQRFIRPVCFQNVPDTLLPPALQQDNPLRIPRLVDGAMTRAGRGT
jgi:alpha-ketoglutaric semialdehyde dehydrogenase